MTDLAKKVNTEELMRYLNEEAKTNMVLANAMKKENKSSGELVDYILMKVLQGGCSCAIIDSNTIMTLATEYYVDDSIVVPNLYAPKKETKPVEKKEATPTKPTPTKIGKTKEVAMPTLFDF